MKADKFEKLRAQVSKLESISTAPVVLQPLLEILRLPAEAIRFDKVVELVSYDSAIAAQCLRMANSPLFGRREVETTRAAIMALGLQRVRSMLFGLCMNRVLPQDKWVFAPVAFWRHSLGCALVTQRMAQRIGYADPEKAYLAGLLHDLGILVNSLLCTEDFRKCVDRATAARGPLHVHEAETLGFSHCESGQLLAEHWRLPADLVQVIHGHHDSERLVSATPLVCLVHLSDLLCRVRNLGYGYDEVLSVELGADPAWQTLVKTHPSLVEMDVARFTMDIDGAMDQIVEIVDNVFGGGRPSQETRAVDSRTTSSGSTTISRG